LADHSLLLQLKEASASTMVLDKGTNLIKVGGREANNLGSILKHIEMLLKIKAVLKISL